MMEQIVVILVFAICSAVCVSIFVESYLMEQRTLEEKHAILAASSAAETYKALGGDAGGTVLVLGGADGNPASSGRDYVVFYDSRWEACGEDAAEYLLRITRLDNPDELLWPAEITVVKTDGGETLFALPVTANAASSALAHLSVWGGAGDE
jgi:type II secretory pathway pseudopilin PulG